MSDNIAAFDSAEYDRKIRRTVPFYDEIYRQITDLVSAYKGSASLTWLDAGCGTGKTAEAALSSLPIKRFVFLDSSPEMLDISRQRFCGANTDTEFIAADVRDVSFNEYFDVVTAVLVNHYFDRQGRLKAVKNCYDALKQDGIFISVENFAPNSGNGKELYLKRWEEYRRENGCTQKECADHTARCGRNYFPITISEHLRVLEEAGFRASEIFWLSYMQVGLMGIK